ncbi:protein tyrosine/serine phosphatase [Agrobacterium vitis]|nr:protein tyrosine/serine phosphatase [Agrobacterium vitis]MBE1437324.1 protein tyrosine/serine phosphatase [Agrobacterium vitis]
MCFSISKIAQRATLTLMVGAAICGAYLGYLRLSGNFHEVIPGEFYRSGQPTASQIADYARRYNIKTIVNLRGASDAPWYQQEIRTSQALGIDHIDFGMVADEELTVSRMQQLVVLLKNAPKPILIHCLAGADRSGLASVIYLQQIAKINEDAAEIQLWPVLYGHVGIPYVTATYAMDRSWRDFEKAMGIEHRTENGAQFSEKSNAKTKKAIEG